MGRKSMELSSATADCRLGRTTLHRKETSWGKAKQPLCKTRKLREAKMKKMGVGE